MIIPTPFDWATWIAQGLSVGCCCLGLCHLLIVGIAHEKKIAVRERSWRISTACFAAAATLHYLAT